MDICNQKYSPHYQCRFLFFFEWSEISFLINCFWIKERELDEIIKQSLISQLESIKVDDDETKETIEKHQLESLAANQQLHEKDDDLAQKEKMDAFEAKLEKVKAENEAVMEGKSTLDVKNLAKNNKKKEKKADEEEEDEKWKF